MRWPLSALLLAITIAACSLGVITAFWKDSHPNHPLLMGVYILTICVSTVAAIFGTSSFRGAFAGVSLFGTAYLIFVLHGGFGLVTIHDSEWLASNTKLGLALMGIAFLASKLTQLVSWPSSELQSNTIFKEEPKAQERKDESLSNRRPNPPTH